MADPRVSNPAYDDPYLAGIASNIGKMFSVGNMGKTIVQRAQAQHYQLQNDKLAMEAAKRSAIAGQFRNANGGPITPQQFDAITADSFEGGMKPSDVAGLTLYRQSNTAQPDSVIARSFVGAGHGLNKGEGVSMEDREGIRSRDAANSKAASDSSAGIHAGATIAAANIAEGGRMARRWDAPHNTSEGAAVNYNPADPRFKDGPPSGSVLAPKPLPADHLVKAADPNDPTNVSGVFLSTKNAEGARVAPGRASADKFVESTDADGVTTYQPVSPGLPGKAPHVTADKTVVVEGPDGKPVYMQASEAIKSKAAAATARQPATVDTKEAEANAIAYNALQSIGATMVDGGTVTMHPDFLAMYGDKLPAAKEAAVKARQTSKNPGAAEAAFLEALGIPAGRMFKPKGTPIVGSGPAAMVPRPGAPASAPAAVADPLDGRTATGPNGQKVIRRGGQWVPVQ